MLNAYWHQRFGQVQSIPFHDLISFVLNAYWHQRFGQPSKFALPSHELIGAQRLLASKVWAGYTVLEGVSQGWIVLNAYWHQRFGQNFI